MEGGERKEEVSLPRDYVSLAQLQERWLRKQEESKLKQKQEEEDKKRESDARAQNEKNLNAKTAGVIQDKGKGKEIVGGNGGEIHDKRRKFYGRREKGKFKGVEMKEKAEVLSGGVEVGVEEIGYVSVVEVLPINGEIADVERTGLRKKGRNWGSRRVNELKRSEVVLDLEEEDENDRGMKWRERGRDRREERGRNGGGVNELKQNEVTLDLEKKDDENDRGMKWKERGRDRRKERGKNGGGVNELKQNEVALDLEKKDDENDHGMKWRERGGNGGGVNELKQSEVALDLEKEDGNDCGMKWRERGRHGGGMNELKQSEVALDLEKEDGNVSGVKWRERGTGRNRGEEKGGNAGRVNELKQSELMLDVKKEKEDEDHRGVKWRERGRNGGRVNDLKQSEVALDLEKEKEEEGENGRGMKWKERGGERDKGRGRNGGYPERRINRLKEYKPDVLTGNEVDSKLENKAEDGISEVCSEISSLNVGDNNRIQGQDNKVKESGVERQYLNGDKVAVEIEKKKVDHEALARKSENFERGYRTNGNPRGGYERGYRTNGNPRGGYERGYRTNGNPRGGFQRGRRYTRPQISDKMNSTESVMVWVKKEDKLDA